jgi:fatty acid-binding protein 3
MSFAGKFKLKTSENFDEYMKAVGVGLVTRKMANAASPVQEIQINGDEWYIKTTTTFKTTEVRFKLGEEFEEVTGDGRNCKSVMKLDGSKLVHIQKDPAKESTIIREVNGNEMTMVLKVDDVVCTRVYDKID